MGKASSYRLGLSTRTLFDLDGFMPEAVEL
jgi:hypothetical protein